MSRTARLRDGLLLAVGTLLAVPVPPPRVVDRRVGAVAMALAAPVGVALGLLLALAASLGLRLGLPPFVVAVLVVALAAAATRFLHVDGLADTADGLMVAGDRARALEVMRRGDVGPVGVAVLVLVLLGQVVAVADLLGAGITGSTGTTGMASWRVSGLLVLAVTVSRAVLSVVTVRGVRAARPDGLGRAVVGVTPRWVAMLVVSVLLAVGVALAGTGGAAVVAVGVLAGAGVALHAHRRLGGLTGDVLGASVEVGLLGALVAASTVA